MSDDKRIRFLLCSAVIANQTGSNVFIFHGEKYQAVAVFKSMKDLLDYQDELMPRKIAKVLFHNEGKINSRDPHTFIGWIEEKLPIRKISQTQGER